MKRTNALIESVDEAYKELFDQTGDNPKFLYMSKSDFFAYMPLDSLVYNGMDIILDKTLSRGEFHITFNKVMEND